MVRSAEDDFNALRMIDAMEAAGAIVVALTANGTATYDGALAPHNRFQVWARVQNDDHIDRIDEAIETALDDEKGTR